MIELLLSLFIASFVGSIIWIVQISMRPITQKLFSQTWHYYSTLIPVFFLLGGTDMMVRIISLVRSALSNNSAWIHSEFMVNQVPYVPMVEHTTAVSLSFIQRWVDSLLTLGNIHDWVIILLGTWAAGVVVVLWVNAKKYLAFKRFILDQSQVANISINSVKVFKSPNAMTPMVIGFLHPVIVMPDTPLGQKEMTMILSHELIHLKRRDLVVKFIVFLAHSIHWFNPFVYSLSKQTNIYCELSCDEKVVQEMDIDDRRFYGEILLSMLEYGVKRRNHVGVSSLCPSKKDMKRRLGNLMSVKKTKKSMVMLSLIASIALVGSGGLAANFASAAASPSSKYRLEGGRNVTVTSSDGTTISYDKEGNIIPTPARQAPREMTTDEILKRIVMHMEKGIPVPEGYVADLTSKGETDALAALFDGLTTIDLLTQDGVATFNVADLLQS
ncbi:M56 family metallopeptidase [Paenibacillus sp. SYP-B4298]|uniref:M56 family metallopeptidase n=1 Tax=Paenibacillus sp. SYP-B4298 TaxID=2996034 RepID=UPI0022DD4280|nr:M56 family metallopeptidase [Paenibacillus sp. SYP-B4298]